MKRFFVLSLSTLVLFFGCAGSKPKLFKNKDFPEWYLNPPNYDDKFVGVGDALRTQFSLSKQVATERARVEVAHAVETTLNSSLYFHIQALGMGMEAGANEFFESVVKSLVSITLKGCIIEKTEICKDRVFVMVTYDVKKVREDAKAFARKLEKKEESLYNQFKARQAFDSLDRGLDEMKGSSSIAKTE